MGIGFCLSIIHKPNTTSLTFLTSVFEADFYTCYHNVHQLIFLRVNIKLFEDCSYVFFPKQMAVFPFTF